MLNLIQKGIDVLEVGSGNGQWLIAFSKFANHVEGIEPDKKYWNILYKSLRNMM